MGGGLLDPCVGYGADRQEADSGEQGTPAKAGTRSCRRHAGRKGARYMWAALLARIYGVFALQCSRCGGRVHVVVRYGSAKPVNES